MSFRGFLSTAAYFRNFIFGVEDSLVSTVGLLSGIAAAGVPRGTILITGAVLIFVEAVSMAAGSFLSEHSAREYTEQAQTPSRTSYVSGVIMFFSYFLSGFVPLAPYLYFPVERALPISILFSIIALFILGITSARITQSRLLASGLRMAVVGAIAIGVGFAAGELLSRFA